VSDELYLPDGTPVRMGCLQPEEMRFAAVPKWEESNPVLPRDQWEEHDDYAPHMLGIKYQQNNNCTNASLAGLAETAFRAAGMQVPSLSSTYLYSMTNGGRDAGAMCRDVAWTWLQQGLAPEEDALEGQIYAPRGGWPLETKAKAAKYKPLEIYQCMNADDVGSALTRRFLVYFGLCLGNRFFSTPKDGRVPPWDGSTRGGHAMYARGITKRFGDLRFIVPNSWSKSFGESGIGYMPLDYFWAESGNFINLDAYAVRAVKRNDDLPDVKG
jgi:hypothetical protein